MSDFGADELSLESEDASEGTSGTARSSEENSTPRTILAGLCIALGLFHLVPEYTPSLYDSIATTFEFTWILTVRPFADLGVWAGLWTWETSRAFVWAYAIGLVGLGVVTHARLSDGVARDATVFFGGNLVTYWLLLLFWDEWGSFGQFLTGDILYTGLSIALIGMFVAWIDT
ncbi:hypothetical protein ACFQH2_14845 [Natronoarchaeum sp. GCM10025703]|uniref:hypothetical protein n=1 Tax=unclassified Natronoarchaeum TaxID=2620183 RepID=UPI0036185616